MWTSGNETINYGEILGWSGWKVEFQKLDITVILRIFYDNAPEEASKWKKEHSKSGKLPENNETLSAGSTVLVLRDLEKIRTFLESA